MNALEKLRADTERILAEKRGEPVPIATNMDDPGYWEEKLEELRREHASGGTI